MTTRITLTLHDDGTALAATEGVLADGYLVPSAQHWMAKDATLALKALLAALGVPLECEAQKAADAERFLTEGRATANGRGR